jgi:GGDEF domain-containing protein
MTGLPNRIAFNERLAFDAAEAHEKAHKLAAFSIDIDGFKDVNDVFGHAAGDLLLIEAAPHAQRWAERIPGAAKRRRISGAADVGQPSRRRAGLCRANCGRVRPTVHGAGPAVTLTASIGYSIFPIDTPERDHALSNAKLAMHRGKSKQRG